ncbi:MAG TPA: zinc-binding dehydrogenase [Dehalococcoidia bacterium]|nr:zinc-binding dehydrogenase [Dehalococcoidia bacterium]
MRAVVMREGELVVDQVPDPVPGEGELLVRTLACGICGSDLHALLRARRIRDGEQSSEDSFLGTTGEDVVMGHEFCAEIIDFGPGTERKLEIGTRVVSVPGLVRPEGRAGIGYSTEWPGGYGELMVLSEQLALPVPDHLSSEQAAMTETMAVGEHAVALARIEDGDVPLVIGCGPVGQAVIAALRLRRLGPIIASDYSAKRRELATIMGADIVVDPAERPAIDVWREAADAPEGRDERSALIFECVGVPGMIQGLIDDAPRNSRALIAGVCMEDDVIEPLSAIGKQINLQFVLGYTPEEFAATLRALSTEQIDVAPLITGRVDLDGVDGAFKTLADPESHAKIMVVPGLDG